VEVEGGEEVTETDGKPELKRSWETNNSGANALLDCFVGWRVKGNVRDENGSTSCNWRAKGLRKRCSANWAL